METEKATNKQAAGDIPARADDAPAYVEIALSQDGLCTVGSDLNSLKVDPGTNPADYGGNGIYRSGTGSGNYTLNILLCWSYVYQAGVHSRLREGNYQFLSGTTLPIPPGTGVI